MGSWWVLLNTVTYVATLHVLHVEAVLSLFAFLVLLLLTAAFLNDTEAAGEDEERGHYSDGDERPWRHCRASWEKKQRVIQTSGDMWRVISRRWYLTPTKKKIERVMTWNATNTKMFLINVLRTELGLHVDLKGYKKKADCSLSHWTSRFAQHFEGRTIWLEFKSIKHLQHNDALVHWFSWSSEAVKHLCRTVRYYCLSMQCITEKDFFVL